VSGEPCVSSERPAPQRLDLVVRLRERAETLGWRRIDLTSIELMLDAAEHIEKLRGIIGKLSAEQRRGVQ